ncbi:metallophosphoesterase family protein [Plasticicumulans acidivorans]|uniref:Putative phosphodiesterase n=1 Tax=Plasticicumulans acidivorans TaxID=886464 RepID=A0A317N5A3_9GAMM|nr:putative phosphodiesterase [Plasticicumulans acidivorans]
MSACTLRLALVSDIHGNLPALEAVAADIHHRGVDQIVNLGDSVSGPLLPRETAQWLMAAGWPSLAGNHERQLLTQAPAQMGASDAFAHAALGAAEFAWLRAQPATLRLSDEVLLCHGTPASDLIYCLETIDAGRLRLADRQTIAERLGAERSALVACGHSHTPRSVRCGGQLIVNPGSVGLPAFDADRPEFHVAETGSADARYALVERRADGQWSAQLIAVPYDTRVVVQLAVAAGRDEWARALSTGYAS